MRRNENQQRVFDEWLTEHKGLVFKIVRSYAFAIHDQDDLFQEIALKLWKSIPKFKGDSAVTTWIYRVSLNAAISWMRREKTRRNREESIDVESYLLQPQSNGNDGRIDWLYEIIGKLDAIDRSIFLMMLDGFSYKDIADTLGISENNVGVKIHRLKSDLKEQLKEEVKNEI